MRDITGKVILELLTVSTSFVWASAELVAPFF